MRLLWTSDQHTAHKRTPTHHVLGNLSKFLVVDHDPAKTDIVIFGGDFMEDLVNFKQAEGKAVTKWGGNYLHQSHSINPKMIAVWLEGTSSHDWGQPEHFVHLAPEGMDVRYVDTLCVHTYEQLDGLTIMYVPDNMGALTPDEIWELALKVLKENNMDMVDIVCAHFAFDFELHTKVRHKGHSLERWETITRHYILAGHIHTPVSKGKLRRSGSFDRTAHGEEHAKGGYRIEFDKKTDVFESFFYENKNALPYITLNVEPNIQALQLVKDIHACIRENKMPAFSQLRVVGGSSLVVGPVLEVMAREYPLMGFDSETTKAKDQLLSDDESDHRIYEGITLVKENIAAHIWEEAEPRFEQLAISKDEALNVLQEFL